MPIVGAAVVSHVPPIAMPIEERKEMNNGVDTALVAGLEQLRGECRDEVCADTLGGVHTQ